MANEVIMLAKHGITPNRLNFPVIISDKLDGVAADFYNDGETIYARSRQGEPLLSVQHIQDHLYGVLMPGEHLIGELYIPTEDFKDIGGKVRSHSNQPDLILFVYDFYREFDMNMEYAPRMALARERLAGFVDEDMPVRFIVTDVYGEQGAMERAIEERMAAYPNMEGMVIRCSFGPDSTYKIGKRSYGMQTVKRQETKDLMVVSVEEAIDKKTGLGLKMVGRINCLYNNMVTGVGPGKLTHEERVEIFADVDKYIGKVMEVAYKPDASYSGLREARFYRWRPDKL